jgi:hypothetical protein
LPVNIQNFDGARRGILGDRFVRDIFLLAEELGIQTPIPLHWEVFSANSVGPKENQAVYHQEKPGFNL